MGAADGVFRHPDCMQRQRCVRHCPKKALTAEACQPRGGPGRGGGGHFMPTANLKKL